MSVVDPTIDELLAVTDENRYLLCEMAARRARDINDMLRNQQNRAEQLQIKDVASLLSDSEGRSPNPLSIAFSEIVSQTDELTGEETPALLGYDQAFLNQALGLSCPEEPEPESEHEPEGDANFLCAGMASLVDFDNALGTESIPELLSEVLQPDLSRPDTDAPLV